MSTTYLKALEFKEITRSKDLPIELSNAELHDLFIEVSNFTETTEDLVTIFKILVKGLTKNRLDITKAKAVLSNAKRLMQMQVKLMASIQELATEELIASNSVKTIKIGTIEDETSATD